MSGFSHGRTILSQTDQVAIARQWLMNSSAFILQVFATLSRQHCFYKSAYLRGSNNPITMQIEEVKRKAERWWRGAVRPTAWRNM